MAITQQLLSELKQETPEVYRLAQLVSFAVRVDPTLLRHMRRKFLTDQDAGLEADLWFSPIVAFRSPKGIVLDSEIADSLRKALASEDINRYEEAWRETELIHRNISPALLLEEKIAYLQYSRHPQATEEIRTLIRSVLFSLVQEDRRGLANWAARALPKLPAVIQELEESRILAISAYVRLDGELQAKELMPLEREVSGWLAWLLPSDIPKVAVGVQLTKQGISFGDLKRQTEAHSIDVPRTNPLILEIAFDSVSKKTTRHVEISAKTSGKFKPVWFKAHEVYEIVGQGKVWLQTLLGEQFLLSKENIDFPRTWNDRQYLRELKIVIPVFAAVSPVLNAAGRETKMGTFRSWHDQIIQLHETAGINIVGALPITQQHGGEASHKRQLNN